MGDRPLQGDGDKLARSGGSEELLGKLNQIHRHDTLDADVWGRCLCFFLWGGGWRGGGHFDKQVGGGCRPAWRILYVDRPVKEWVLNISIFARPNMK